MSFVKFVSSQEKTPFGTQENLSRHNNGFQLQAGIVPKAEVNTIIGNYQLQSKFQSCFNGGIVYQVNLDSNWNMSYGLQLNIINANYFSNIPATDLQGYPGNANVPQIWDKQAYFRLALPALLSYNFLFAKQGFYTLRAGVKLNFSGFSADEITTSEIADSGRQLTKIFHGDFSSNNNNKPWLTYLASLSKTFLLKNGGLFSVDLFGELSTTSYIKANYQITIPNQPVTEGELYIKGSCIGLSFQYLFPGKKNKVSQ